MKRPPLRRLWRAAREIPMLGAVVSAADRIWWFRAIARSPLVDTGFYAAQRGRRATSRSIAILHYVSFGFRRGFSLNPMFDEIFAGGGLPEVFRVPALYAYLVSDRPTVTIHPWWDAVAHGRGSGAGPALETVWAARDQAHIALTAGDVEVDVSVDEFRAWSLEAAAEWGRGDLSGSTGSGTGDRARVIRVVQQRDRRFARKLDQLARLSTRDVDPIGVLVEPDAAQWISARLLARIVPTVRVSGVRHSRSWAQVVSEASTGFRGEALVVLDARSEMDDDDIERLIDLAQRGAAVVPCGRAFDGTLVGVGAAHVGASVPWSILQHHPQEDLADLGDEPIEIPLLTGRTFALPSEAFAASRGWDSTLVNEGELEVLSMALRRSDAKIRLLADPAIRPVLEEPERAFRRRRHSRFVAAVRRAAPARDDERSGDLIDGAGFDLLGWRRDRLGRPSPELSRRRATPDSRRWAIKICAPPGRQGAVWGDTHFAEGLASALRRRGHDVVVDAFEARLRPTTYLDDVSVVVRGPYRIDPPPTGVSLQWIISHPDQITKGELSRFDRVFAASASWSRSTAERWGIAIQPLLECTDTDKFLPRGLERGDDIVFVGTARGIPRPSVVAPLAAGVPVRVYGPDWRPFIPAAAINATSIPNDDLPERYETASVVLNDQWPAMRRLGFIAMRPFDAVAVGGRVISEEVEDIERIFQGAVVTYRDAAHLVDLLRQDPDELFPDAATLTAIAAHVRLEHSFDARAAVLDEASRESAAPSRNSGPPRERG